MIFKHFDIFLSNPIERIESTDATNLPHHMCTQMGSNVSYLNSKQHLDEGSIHTGHLQLDNMYFCLGIVNGFLGK